MLVLSRKVNETVVIDDKIVVTVVRCNNGEVRLGFEADRSIPIVRGELISRREAQQA